ncbi:hypothetical protein SCHPADRAFT_909847 [Schizopora paradoxa]|uniref:Uncharacterized protein n=1 Tax=Schizopora paradoxa TaxID=27342 RepID=A0A0H2R6P5_9AGAM|nr:hypothetical protein SCHPADRAFT_909847 [Schizopora paradoxa]
MPDASTACMSCWLSSIKSTLSFFSLDNYISRFHLYPIDQRISGHRTHQMVTTLMDDTSLNRFYASQQSSSQSHCDLSTVSLGFVLVVRDSECYLCLFVCMRVCRISDEMVVAHSSSSRCSRCKGLDDTREGLLSDLVYIVLLAFDFALHLSVPGRRVTFACIHTNQKWFSQRATDRWMVPVCRLF